jgi:hypothetical protein
MVILTQLGNTWPNSRSSLPPHSAVSTSPVHPFANPMYTVHFSPASNSGPIHHDELWMPQQTRECDVASTTHHHAAMTQQLISRPITIRSLSNFSSDFFLKSK